MISQPGREGARGAIGKNLDRTVGGHVDEDRRVGPSASHGELVDAEKRYRAGRRERRDGQDVVQDDQCRAVSGTWYSEYDGLTIDSASRIDIDHVVPLKEAWRSGASQWTTPERRAFANDLIDSQLIAVSAGSNRGKGDKDPGNWKPPLQSYRCTYSRAWISVKATYRLTANPAEAEALSGMLDTCDV
ncbi:HNH endonuclease family protein [Streptomyces sp. NBC_01005]|uniref:HNH endonuclease family protein n=1 Tax=unclassified Streptomyces TaxID=2593676 RepID=UPI002E365627|nr:HNH endonuclease family protein [Streptomyces sp. NBC_01362]WSW10154.1 HNH endonuclease family protein [Streptomyces sp. NBC_01005]WTC99664.1 HNH endonuclease family protein [Streptomyces sp. NBC_01650]